MPLTAADGRYPSSVQFIRQRMLGNEASRHKHTNGRGQSKGARVRAPLSLRQQRQSPACATKFPPSLLHWAIMA